MTAQMPLLHTSRVHPNHWLSGLFVGDESKQIAGLYPEICRPQMPASSSSDPGESVNDLEVVA
jgi:hypothetical protein